jgi:hypothetical protein
MKKIKFFLFISCLCFLKLEINAQDAKSYKIGKITVSDFNVPELKFDSGANAVIISDIGSARFEGNNKGYFTLFFTHYMKVKIINNNGFDIGKFEIELYHDDEESEKLFSIKGSTFNLENGVISETKLDEKSIFNEKYNSRIDEKKFTMPALKAGSIFELEYVVKSPFDFNLQPWSFDGDYPRLLSEYSILIPPPLHYVMRMQGQTAFDLDTTKAVFENLVVRVNNGTNSDDVYNITGASTYRKWIKKNVPALHEEPYTTNIDNYYSRVKFQLKYIQWTKESERHEQGSTWNLSAKRLLENQDFGLALNSNNGWMADDLAEITKGAGSNREKTRKIYEFIRDNFKAEADEGYGIQGLYVHHSLKDVFKRRQGNVAEINLLLTAMLRKAGIEADPMIISTRDHGIADPSYPLLEDYNYVVCVSRQDDDVFLLDASQKYGRFGQLPVSCYNGWGHVMNEETPFPLYFSSDSLDNENMTNIIIINDEKGKASGSLHVAYGVFESTDMREEIGSTSIPDYQKKIQESKGKEMAIENLGFDSLKNYDFPLALHYDFVLNDAAKSDVMYFNPMLGEGLTENPFKSMERHYPVEMPYRINETYVLNMDIPAGYQVDELPKSARVIYNDNEGMFEYLIQKGDGNIQMRVKLNFNKAFFPTDEYGILRDFFAAVVKKEQEQIVFKKIK